MAQTRVLVGMCLHGPMSVRPHERTWTHVAQTWVPIGMYLRIRANACGHVLHGCGATSARHSRKKGS